MYNFEFQKAPAPCLLYAPAGQPKVPALIYSFFWGSILPVLAISHTSLTACRCARKILFGIGLASCLIMSTPQHALPKGKQAEQDVFDFQQPYSEQSSDLSGDQPAWGNGTAGKWETQDIPQQIDEGFQPADEPAWGNGTAGKWETQDIPKGAEESSQAEGQAGDQPSWGDGTAGKWETQDIPQKADGGRQPGDQPIESRDLPGGQAEEQAAGQPNDQAGAQPGEQAGSGTNDAANNAPADAAAASQDAAPQKTAREIYDDLFPPDVRKLWPSVRSLVTSSYGEKRILAGPNGKAYIHTGLDIRAHLGWPIRSLRSGVVTQAGPSGPAGLMVQIEQSNGKVVSYAHMSKILVKEGQKVTRGQHIGKVGCTGRTTGAHLHIAIKNSSGSPINPTKEIKGLWELFDPPISDLERPIDSMACTRAERMKDGSSHIREGRHSKSGRRLKSRGRSSSKKQYGAEHYRRMRKSLPKRTRIILKEGSY